MKDEFLNFDEYICQREPRSGTTRKNGGLERCHRFAGGGWITGQSSKDHRRDIEGL